MAALSPQGAEHAVPAGQSGGAAVPAVPLALQLAGGGGAAAVRRRGLGAVARGGRPPGPARRPGAARPPAARRWVEDEDDAAEALQGLLRGAPPRPALRLLQEQPPAQAAEAVAPRPLPGGASPRKGPLWGSREGRNKRGVAV